MTCFLNNNQAFIRKLQSDLKPKRLVYMAEHGAPDEPVTGQTMPDLLQQPVLHEDLAQKIKALERKGVDAWLIDKSMAVLGQLEDKKNEKGQQALQAALEKITEEGTKTYEKKLDEIRDNNEKIAASGAPASAEEPKEEGTVEQQASGKKPVAGGAVIGDIQSEMARKLEATVSKMESYRRQVENQEPVNKKLAEKVKDIHGKIKTLAEIESTAQEKTTELLEEAVKKRQISREDAEAILDIDQENDEKMQKEVYSALEDMITGSAGGKDLAIKIVNAKKAEAKLYRKVLEDYEKMEGEFQLVMQELAENITNEVNRERSLKEAARYLGVPLKEGTVLRLKEKRSVVDEKGNVLLDSNGNAMEEPVFRRATITKVAFENVEFETAEGIKKSLPDTEPKITLKFEDEEADASGKKQEGTQTLNAAMLKKHMDILGMVEPIEEDQSTESPVWEQGQLMEIIGLTEQIGPGSRFEYRIAKKKESFSQDKTSIHEGKLMTGGKDQMVEVLKITKEEDPFFTTGSKKGYKQTYIYLDQEVEIGHTDEDSSKPFKSKKLTLGEFARWYKRMNAFPPMKMEEVKVQLKKMHQERQQQSPNHRTPEKYPPIECEPGEVLYFDTPSRPTFVIESADDKGVRLDNGSEFTPASFYNWVKENEAEKMTPKAEAHKTADKIQDEEERKKAFALAQEKAAEELAKRKDPKDPKHGDHTSHDEHNHEHSASYLEDFWNRTTFLSFSDLYMIGHEVYEYFPHSYQHHQKERVGNIGKAAFTPFNVQLGAQYQVMQQSAENEAVNKYTEAYKQFGPSDLYERMEITHERDELKAILNCLADKGAIRWEEPILWKALNKIQHHYAKKVHLHIDSADEEKMRMVIDDLWGGQSYYEIKSKNDSAYNSQRDKFSDVARRLENDPTEKNVKKALSEMLFKHLKGEYIDPAVFEGHVHWAIKGGKMGFADKLYFLMMGLGAHGGTRNAPLLTMTRVSDLGSLNGGFPALDYFSGTGKFPWFNENDEKVMIPDEKTGKMKQKIGPLNVNHVRRIMEKYILKDQGKALSAVGEPKELLPGKNFQEFVAKELMYDAAVQERIEKAVNDLSNTDHDDMHMMAPHLSEQMADKGFTIQGAGRAQATDAGVKNAFVGFNDSTKMQMEEFMKNQQSGNEEAANNNLKYWMKPIRAFVRTYAILDSRVYHTVGHDRRRWTSEFDQKAGVSERNVAVRQYVNEMDKYIGKFIHEMGQIPASQLAALEPEERDHLKKMPEIWKVMKQKWPRKPGKEQTEQEAQVLAFGENFETALKLLQKSVGNNGIARMMATAQNENGQPVVKGNSKS